MGESMSLITLPSFLSAVSQGLLWSILAIGVYITYRVLDFADLTTEGSFPLGAAVAAQCIVNGGNPFTATVMSFAVGLVAGFVTGILHTKLKIPGLLAGILVMTGLYSINLRVMGGKANLPLLKQTTIITAVVERFSTEAKAFSNANAVMLVGIVSVVVVIFILWLMFSTEFGFALRATGDNPKMISALGVNTDIMIILGLMISNGLISLAGGLIAQYNGYADVGMGVGTIVIGLASVIIGEVLLGRRGMAWCLCSVVVGSILYRIIIALVLANKLQPTDLKLFSSIVLVICLSLPAVKEWYRDFTNRRNQKVQA